MNERPLHAVTWLVWAVAAAVSVQAAPNPLYVAAVIGIGALVVEAHNAGGLLSRAFPILVGVGLAFGAIKVLLTILTTHGTGRALVTLPELTLPQLLGGFTVGGTVEDIVLARAMAEAFAIVGVMAAFGAFNAVVSHDELVRSFPHAFHEPGVVLTVGLAFVPATITSARLVAESDRCRTGGQVRHRGRLVRLTVPLLERGMERAVLLADSMDARGFARTAGGPSERWAGWLGLAGMLSLVTMLIALVGRSTTIAAGLLAAGIVCIAGAVVLASRESGRTRYRPRRPGWFDGIVIVASVSAATGIVVISARGGSLTWPAGNLGWPPVEFPVLLLLALLAVPALRPRHLSRTADGDAANSKAVSSGRRDERSVVAAPT